MENLRPPSEQDRRESHLSLLEDLSHYKRAFKRRRGDRLLAVRRVGPDGHDTAEIDFFTPSDLPDDAILVSRTESKDRYEKLADLETEYFIIERDSFQELNS